MKKCDAIAIFGSRNKSLAEALGLTASAVSQWPDVLPQPLSDRVLGAALRSGKLKLSAASICLSVVL